MSEEKFNITPETKIDQLLKIYPELEATLVDIAPAFQKLKNPVLRRTIAKVTSLRQAAKIGNVPLAEVINRLRTQVGQQMIEDEAEGSDSSAMTQPDWFNSSKLIKTIDARPMLEASEEPVKFVFKELDKIGSGQILELVTPFLPAPLISMAQQKGFQVWTKRTADNYFSNYFLKR
ncbi:MAG: DUF1858 domain-containing protein [Candidatus Zhuqueibacterota bacterium]